MFIFFTLWSLLFFMHKYVYFVLFLNGLHYDLIVQSCDYVSFSCYKNARWINDDLN